MKVYIIKWMVTSSIMMLLYLILNLLGSLLILYTDHKNESSISTLLIAPFVLNIFIFLLLLVCINRKTLAISIFGVLSLSQVALFQSLEGSDLVWEIFKAKYYLGFAIYKIASLDSYQSIFVPAFSFIQLTSAFLVSKNIVHYFQKIRGGGA